MLAEVFRGTFGLWYLAVKTRRKMLDNWTFLIQAVKHIKHYNPSHVIEASRQLLHCFMSCFLPAASRQPLCCPELCIRVHSRCPEEQGCASPGDALSAWAEIWNFVTIYLMQNKASTKQFRCFILRVLSLIQLDPRTTAMVRSQTFPRPLRPQSITRIYFKTTICSHDYLKIVSIWNTHKHTHERELEIAGAVRNGGWAWILPCLNTWQLGGFPWMVHSHCSLTASNRGSNISHTWWQPLCHYTLALQFICRLLSHYL